MAKQWKNISFLMTCEACPEQYDAYFNDEIVGYLRLRHGVFTVRVPSPSGMVVYRSGVQGDGAFWDEEEREFHLKRAKKAIWNTIKVTG